MTTWIYIDRSCPIHTDRKLLYTRSRQYLTCPDLHCTYKEETGEYVEVPFTVKERQMPLPRCEFAECVNEACYDFVASDDTWKYGCVDHWKEHRKSAQMGPGHAQRLSVYGALPVRDDLTLLAKPSLGDPSKPRKARSSGSSSTAPRERPPKEFQNMEPSPEGQKTPKPGSTMDVALQLARAGDAQGFTLAELQSKLDEMGKHDALKLLRFMHTDRGWGWIMNEQGLIKVLPG